MKKTLMTLGAILMATSAIATTYTIKNGDTLTWISRDHSTTIPRVLELNTYVKNPDLIYAGKYLALDDKVAATPVAVDSLAPNTTCEACDNVINGNPLYRPAAGHFYSVTSVETAAGASSETSFDNWALNEVLGYGITDSLSIWIDTTASTHEFDGYYPWSQFGGGVNARLLDSGNWKGDVYGKLAVIGGEDWWHEDLTGYKWTAGTKFGYASCWWTLNGLFEYDYTNSEAFNWGDESDLRTYRAGIEGQLVLTSWLNVVANVKYEMPEIVDNFYTGMLGMNVNVADNAYVGVYAEQSMTEDEGKFANDTTLGLQFGIDF